MKSILYNIYKSIIYKTIPNVSIVKKIFSNKFKICYNISQNLVFYPSPYPIYLKRDLANKLQNQNKKIDF